MSVTTRTEHRAALVTKYRAICVCGWHKPTRGGKDKASALLMRHLINPATPATIYEDSANHVGCNIDNYLKAAYRWCTDHEVWVDALPNTEEAERLF